MTALLFGIFVLLFLIWRAVDTKDDDGGMVYYDGCDLEALGKEERRFYMKAAAKIALAIGFIVAIWLSL